MSPNREDGKFKNRGSGSNKPNEGGESEKLGDELEGLGQRLSENIEVMVKAQIYNGTKMLSTVDTEDVCVWGGRILIFVPCT